MAEPSDELKDRMMRDLGTYMAERVIECENEAKKVRERWG